MERPNFEEKILGSLCSTKPRKWKFCNINLELTSLLKRGGEDMINISFLRVYI